MFALITFIQLYTGGPSQCSKTRRRNEGIYRIERVKLLFTGGMYVESSKESAKQKHKN